MPRNRFISIVTYQKNKKYPPSDRPPPKNVNPTLTANVLLQKNRFIKQKFSDRTDEKNILMTHKTMTKIQIYLYRKLRFINYLSQTRDKSHQNPGRQKITSSHLGNFNTLTNQGLLIILVGHVLINIQKTKQTNNLFPRRLYFTDIPLVTKSFLGDLYFQLTKICTDFYSAD